MDQDLVVRAQQGDERAFESLTVAHHARLFRVADCLLRDRGLAEDATQQAFLDAWRHLPRLRDPARFEGWSDRLLVHACCSRAKRRPDWVSGDELPPVREPRTTADYDAVLDRDALERGFARLSMAHRAVFVLRYLLDMTPAQVARNLGITRWNVDHYTDGAWQKVPASPSGAGGVMWEFEHIADDGTVWEAGFGGPDDDVWPSDGFLRRYDGTEWRTWDPSTACRPCSPPPNPFNRPPTADCGSPRPTSGVRPSMVGSLGSTALRGSSSCPVVWSRRSTSPPMGPSGCV